ncbi:MAG: cache domain-containing protein [Saccharospirillum sp.]
MNLKAKILLLAIAPLLAAAAIITLKSLNHSRQLANQVLAVYENNLVEAKMDTLREQMDLADSAIAHILSDPTLSDVEAQEAVKALLNDLAFGEDGYFFVYDQQGVNLVHPMIPEFVGQNLYDFEDRTGNRLIQRLIEVANDGGGFHRYVWERPPDMVQEDKLGYAKLIEPWGWMYGTGLYLDSIAEEVAAVKASFDDNIRESVITLTLVILGTVLVIVLLGLAINLHEYRQADSRLQRLVQRFLRLQVNERRKLSRELHDGINQQLVSLKYRIELAEKKLEQEALDHPAQKDLNIASTVLNQTIQEVRQISHSLRPVLLDDLGLKPALRALAEHFEEHTRVQVTLDFGLEHLEVPDDIETTIYRITQECLNNIEKHARASCVTLFLGYDAGRILFEVRDNGVGFAPDRATQSGIGLVNMRERVEVIGGTLQLLTTPGGGATISASLPYKKRNRKPNQAA